MNNYDKAKIEADKIDSEIVKLLQEKKTFRVEAGAGSGKTYSLNKAISWIISNAKNEYILKHQKVVCITYTNVAVDVITNRINNETFIVPSTIHSFSWEAIKQYNKEMIFLINNVVDLKLTSIELEEIKLIQYTLGVRYIDNNTLYLHHNDVLKLFCALLDNKKFRVIFESKYPLILIDEYQDSYKEIVDRFIKYFIEEKSNLQFGFFGDSWQTIYSSNGACGLIEHKNIEVVKKNANFRSAPKIVDVLNKLRPDLPQISAIDDYEGEVYVISNNDYIGIRNTRSPFKNDLPSEILKERLNKIKDIIRSTIPKSENINNLMLTHSILATQQGYENVLAKFDNKFKENDDDIIRFVNDIIEPLFESLVNSDMNLLFNTLGTKRYPINTKNEKIKWKNLKDNLYEKMKGRLIDVLKLSIDSMLIPVPSRIIELCDEYINTPDSVYIKDTIKNTLDINYSEFKAAINFLKPNSEFDTNHGVKGNEFDNVIFSITGGWNNYQFDKYIPMINGQIPQDKIGSFERNRNLFYVCCSRPRKRLYIFISLLVSPEFERYLKSLVGNNNYYDYKEFMQKLKKDKITIE